MTFMKYPKILTFVNPKISIQCKPNISVLFKSPNIWTSKSRPLVFLVSKTRFLWNTPRFWQVFYLTFLYTVGPKYLFSLKIPRFWQTKVGHGFFVSKNMVLMKYPKILTYAKPKISIRCKPNIFVLFESPKILTSKSRPWVFGVKKKKKKKKMLLWNTPRFWHLLILRFRYDVSPISLYSLKVPKFWQAKVGHGFFWCQKHDSYEIPQDFDRCFTWHFYTLLAQNLCSL